MLRLELIITKEATPEVVTPIITKEATPIFTKEATPIITKEATPIITKEATPIITKEETPIFTKEVKCFTHTEHNDESSLAKDLECPDNMVCNLESGVCELTNDIKEIKIDGQTISVTGKDEMIKMIKQKIRDLSKVPSPKYEYKKVSEPIVKSEKKSLNELS